jgi:hypothetical protein
MQELGGTPQKGDANVAITNSGIYCDSITQILRPREPCGFSKNRDRSPTSEVAQQFFAEVNKQSRRFMSDEHFTVEFPQA